MLYFSIVEIKHKKLNTFIKFIVKVIVNSIFAAIVLFLICIYFGDYIEWLNHTIVAYVLLLLLFPMVLTPIISILLLVSQGNYKEIGYCSINTTSFNISLNTEQLFDLLSKDITMIEIKYLGYEYSNVFDFPSLESPIVKSGTENNINFIYDNNQYSFFFLSKNKEDKENIITMVNNNTLLKHKVGVIFS